MVSCEAVQPSLANISFKQDVRKPKNEPLLRNCIQTADMLRLLGISSGVKRLKIKKTLVIPKSQHHR